MQIPDKIFEKMKGKSYKSNCIIPREDLAYLRISHIGFDGQTHEGEMVCHRKLADTLTEIFRELYEARYPIEKIRLIDEYDADDESSMADNNSSSFNFRYISYTTTVSKHGLGAAVDINPLYNPYVKTVKDRLSIEPANGAPYVDREKDFPYKITTEDTAYKIFTKYGFEWGGSWTESKDYQHFEMPDAFCDMLTQPK